MAAEEDRNDARRLRGRLASGVTIWTAGQEQQRCGLTVASVIVTEGEPPHVLGTVGDLSDLLETVRATERFVVHVLAEDQRALADRFAGMVPVPAGGAFGDLDAAASPYGPVLTEVGTRAACRLVDLSQRGYPVLIDGEIDEITTSELDGPLTHFRGQYRRLAEPRRSWSATAPDSALPPS